MGGASGSRTVIIKQQTGQSSKVVMSQKAATDALGLKVDKVAGKGLSTYDFNTTQLQRITALEANAYDVFIIDYFQENEPAQIDETIWFDSLNSELYVWIADDVEWRNIPLYETKIYITRNLNGDVSNDVFLWNGDIMVQASAPISKFIIESLLTGVITSHSHNPDNTKADLVAGKVPTEQLPAALAVGAISQDVGENTDLAISQKTFTKLVVFVPVEVQSIAMDGQDKIDFNSCVKAFYLTGTPAANERFVITFFARNGVTNNFQLGIKKYNTVTFETTTIASVTGITYEYDKVVPIYSDSTKTTIVGYIYAKLADYIGVVTNVGQGDARMPYANVACFDYLKQPLINKYLTDETIVTANARIDTIDAKFNFVPVEVQSIAMDGQDKIDFNSCVKAFYLTGTPAANERFVITFFARNGVTNNFQLGIKKYNTVTFETTTIASVTGITYEYDKVVPIYSDSTKTTIVGYIYAKLADYIGVVTNVGQGDARMPYANVACFDYLKQPLINNYFINTYLSLLNDKIDNLDTNKLWVLIWGDSISWGSASSLNTNCYTAIFRQLLIDNGYLEGVINCGVGGENFHNILVRQGAFGFYFDQDITLPMLASERVEIQRSTNYINNRHFRNTFWGADSYFGLLIQGENGRDNLEAVYATVNPIIVNGIECIMTIEGNQQNSITYLAPKINQTGTKLIKTGTFLYPHGNTFKPNLSIFSIGTNSGFYVTGEDISLTVNRYIEMIDLAIQKANSNFIVCSPYGGTALVQIGVSGLEALEIALTKKYGSKHFNWRKYLIEYGLTDAGLTASQADLDAIEIGNVPPSLLSDGLHPNDYGHLVLGKQLFYIAKSLGFITKIV